MNTAKEELKKRVLEYVQSRPGYDPTIHEKLNAFCTEVFGYRVMYGEDEMSGIMGLGENPGLAYKDFVRSWRQLKGFEWLEKNR